MSEIERKFIAVRIAILTVSDTRTETDDKSGNLLARRVEKSGHVVADRAIVPDVQEDIVARLVAWAQNPEVDVVISTGGTGLTGRDVTVEAHRQIYEKEIEAFSTVFSMISMKSIGASAVQSRACGGVARGTYFFALPGSPGACADAWDGILSSQLDYRNKPCNFVEIFPRLSEHERRK